MPAWVLPRPDPARPLYLAASPELVPGPAVLGGGEEGKKQEKRARKKGPGEGRDGVAAEKAGAAGPGVRRRGSAHRRDDSQRKR